MNNGKNSWKINPPARRRWRQHMSVCAPDRLEWVSSVIRSKMATRRLTMSLVGQTECADGRLSYLMRRSRDRLDFESKPQCIRPRLLAPWCRHHAVHVARRPAANARAGLPDRRYGRRLATGDQSALQTWRPDVQSGRRKDVTLARGILRYCARRFCLM